MFEHTNKERYLLYIPYGGTVLVMQHFPSDEELQIKWIHSVAEMRIQQAEQDPSPSKIDPVVAMVDRLGRKTKAALML